MQWVIILGGLSGICIGAGLNLAIRRLSRGLFPELPDQGATSALSAAVIATTVGMTVWVAWHFGPSTHAAVYLIWFCILVVLAGIDLNHFLLPDVLTLPLLALSLVASMAGYSAVSGPDAFLGAAAGYAILRALNAAYRRVRQIDGFGGGDLKFMAAIGAWLGPLGVLNVLTLASVLALACILLASLLRKARPSMRQPIPFGPFLATAAVIVSVSRA